MTPDFPDACREALGRHLDPELFQALCDPVRLGIVAHLAVATEPLTVSEAGACCGIHVSGVSRHLSILRRAGVVEGVKAGREIRLRLRASELASTLRRLADALEECAQGCCPAQEGRDEPATEESS